MAIRIYRDRMAAEWRCPCGWSSPIRDHVGRTVPEPNIPAIEHAKTCAETREADQ